MCICGVTCVIKIKFDNVNSKDYICNMSVNTRISEFINAQGITASQFADTIGVQRSSISHIVSGRNKPSSDFLQKLLKNYPSINAEWLILGIGTMYKTPINTRKDTIKERNLFDDTSVNKYNTSNPTEYESGEKVVKSYISKETEYSSKNDEISNNPIKTPIDTSKSGKTVEKIIIFYTDKTFDTYNPS